ncbi:tetratricopeptide repeat protein [Streptomyces sp. CA-210063]|uniref:tetratricopeptide repeat protein n=1 Tax=Streptomyces sp. CA-210063 TaxID=2801029 RepID=UPI00214ADAC8|nr:tetratricopeptide repeat protein [Streptomyces sp. CA-210063]UUU28543.1 tetratricopeptide repeat protein [Streptomyces sp. CA-210063]
MAKMAIFLRACGLTDASFDLCDQADAIQRIMLTEVVRARTWRKLGDPGQTAAAFERALTLDPTAWSLHLDLADLRAEQGDFTTAVQLIDQGWSTSRPRSPVGVRLNVLNPVQVNVLS